MTVPTRDMEGGRPSEDRKAKLLRKREIQADRVNPTGAAAATHSSNEMDGVRYLSDRAAPMATAVTTDSTGGAVTYGASPSENATSNVVDITKIGDEGKRRREEERRDVLWDGKPKRLWTQRLAFDRKISPCLLI